MANIIHKKTPPADADAWNGVPNKFAEHFSERPGDDDESEAAADAAPQGSVP